MSRPGPRLFDYPAQRVDEVIDGDTISLWIWTERYELKWARIRVLEIDVPDDKKSAMWRDSKLFVVDWLAGRRLRVTTRKEDNFGRVLGDVYDADNGEHLDRAVLAFLKERFDYDAVYSR